MLGDRFRILSLLGGGGMGLVYLAEQVSLGRRVALKVLRDDVLSRRVMEERFRREARLLSSVDHPAVVRVIDFGHHERSMCLVMEFVDGESLESLLERQGAFPVERAERLLAQLAQGLQAIHAQGIIHRDLKPDNVLVSRAPGGEEQARLLDFGVARLMEPDDAPRVTQLGFVVGTPEYMSPEQALGQPLDPRSDLYSLGLIAFRMLTGRAAFTAPSVQELVAKQVHEAPPALLTVQPALAKVPWLVAAVESCLAKDPARRPATAAALLDTLKEKPILLTRTVTSVHRAAGTTRKVKKAQAFRVPRLAWAFLAALLAGGGVGLWVWLRPERVARRLVDAGRGTQALQVIDEASGEGETAALTQLRAAALYQVGRSEEARKLLEALPEGTLLEPEAVEALAEDFGRTEALKVGGRVRKLMASWPKAQVLPVLQQLATFKDGSAQWGALRFVDLEYAGQGLQLVDLYIRALSSRDCARRVIAARRLGDMRAIQAAAALKELAEQPPRRTGLLGMEEEECGQTAAGAALKRIEKEQ